MRHEIAVIIRTSNQTCLVKYNPALPTIPSLPHAISISHVLSFSIHPSRTSSPQSPSQLSLPRSPGDRTSENHSKLTTALHWLPEDIPALWMLKRIMRQKEGGKGAVPSRPERYCDRLGSGGEWWEMRRALSCSPDRARSRETTERVRDEAATRWGLPVIFQRLAGSYGQVLSACRCRPSKYLGVLGGAVGMRFPWKEPLLFVPFLWRLHFAFWHGNKTFVPVFV